MDSNIGGFEVGYLVVGITQLACYRFNVVDGRRKITIAIMIGALLWSAVEAISMGFVTPEVAIIINSIIRVVGNILAVPGMVGFVKEMFNR